MNLDNVVKRINRYLDGTDNAPRLVNAENLECMESLISRFDVSENTFLSIEKYSKKDEKPRMDDFFYDLNGEGKNLFITGLTSYLKLMGEYSLKETLLDILRLKNNCKIVVFCYRCSEYLDFDDLRLSRQIYLLDGKTSSEPEIVFCESNLPITSSEVIIDGIDKLPSTIEKTLSDVIYVNTAKSNKDFGKSLLVIKENKNSYNILCQFQPVTASIKESFGNKNYWDSALEQVEKFGSWDLCICNFFGNTKALCNCINLWSEATDFIKWLYIVGLKLFGTGDNLYLNKVTNKLSDPNKFVKTIYFELLNIDCESADFWNHYNDRKKLLLHIGKTADNEIIDFCNIVGSKEEKAIYYVTDTTEYEKFFIFKFLDQFALTLSRDTVLNAMKKVYPDLYTYLKPYNFRNDLLNNYFNEYKYQKVINHVFDNFLDIVKEQSEKREFNFILPPRTGEIENLELRNSKLYFMDAMGVEFLSFISEKCSENGLKTNIKVCRAELPTVTESNKEFVDYFKKNGITVKSIPDIDKVKHTKTDSGGIDLPLHLTEELKVILGVITAVNSKLRSGQYDRVYLIADHGASRLAVINDDYSKIDVNSKGQHSGRTCALKEDLEKVSFATEADKAYVMAGYDSFKGGRKFGKEVHGGATLEEVAVPIIEIFYSERKIEVILKNPEITFSFRKKAEIELFVNCNVTDLSIDIKGKQYECESKGNGYFRCRIPDIRKSGEYSFDVYADGNKIKENLVFKAVQEGAKENKMFF